MNQLANFNSFGQSSNHQLRRLSHSQLRPLYPLYSYNQATPTILPSNYARHTPLQLRPPYSPPTTPTILPSNYAHHTPLQLRPPYSLPTTPTILPSNYAHHTTLQLRPPYSPPTTPTILPSNSRVKRFFCSRPLRGLSRPPAS